jgi:hypothetical protein
MPVKWERTYQVLYVSLYLLFNYYNFTTLVCESISILRFQVLMAASMKMTVFWDVAPCSLIQTDPCFGGAYCLHHCPNYGGSKNLWNISQFLTGQIQLAASTKVCCKRQPDYNMLINAVNEMLYSRVTRKQRLRKRGMGRISAINHSQTTSWNLLLHAPDPLPHYPSSLTHHLPNNTALLQHCYGLKFTTVLSNSS